MKKNVPSAELAAAHLTAEECEQFEKDVQIMDGAADARVRRVFNVADRLYTIYTADRVLRQTADDLQTARLGWAVTTARLEVAHAVLTGIDDIITEHEGTPQQRWNRIHDIVFTYQQSRNSLAPGKELVVYKDSAQNEKLSARIRDLEALTEAVGLPEGTDLATLIEHHRAQAALAATFEAMRQFKETPGDLKADAEALDNMLIEHLDEPVWKLVALRTRILSLGFVRKDPVHAVTARMSAPQPKNGVQ